MIPILAPLSHYETAEARDVLDLMARRANAGALANAAGALVIGMISLWAPFWPALVAAIVMRLLAIGATAYNGQRLARALEEGRSVASELRGMTFSLFLGGASWGGIFLIMPDGSLASMVGASLAALVMVGITLVAMTAAPVPRAMWSFLAGFVLVSTIKLAISPTLLGPAPFALAALIAIIAGYGHRISRDTWKVIRINAENKRMAETLGHLNEELGHALDRADRLARYDQLTGLRNRRAFEEEAGAIAIRRDSLERWYAAVIDLDRFKAINDTYGHHLGDEYLRRMGVLLGEAEQRVAHAVAARLGGEEFVMLLPARDGDAAIAAAEAVRRDVEAMILDGGMSTLETTTSIGVSPWGAREPIHAALRRADRALYEAKNGGRNQVRMHGDGAPSEIRAA